MLATDQERLSGHPNDKSCVENYFRKFKKTRFLWIYIFQKNPFFESSPTKRPSNHPKCASFPCLVNGNGKKIPQLISICEIKFGGNFEREPL